MTVIELAQALGVTPQAVSRWENGICYPDMELLPSMANFFGVSIDELFGYQTERSQKIDELAERIRAMNAQNNGKDDLIGTLQTWAIACSTPPAWSRTDPAYVTRLHRGGEKAHLHTLLPGILSTAWRG